MAFEKKRKEHLPPTQDELREMEAWDNEPKMRPGRPYDGAIVKDGKLIIPK